MEGTSNENHYIGVEQVAGMIEKKTRTATSKIVFKSIT
jgi:hypothetical protein